VGVWGIFDGGFLMGVLCGRRWREGGVGQHLLLSFDRRKGGGVMCMCLTDLRALLTTCSFMIDKSCKSNAQKLVNEYGKYEIQHTISKFRSYMPFIQW